jgi:superfamily I DNA/RNA helicase
MRYIAVTQPMADWLLAKSQLVEQVYLALQGLVPDGGVLREMDFAQNSVRLSYGAGSEVAALWHLDYVSGTGSENWGFFRWTGDVSILESGDVGIEVFERCLYITSQRLQGLMLDGSFIHRVYDNGAHTVIAGRGSAAHKLSVGYYEQVVGGEGLESRSLVIVGPDQSFTRLKNEAGRAGLLLPQLTSAANSLVNPRAFSKAIAGPESFASLRAAISPYFEQGSSGQLFDSVELHVANTGDHGRYAALTFEEWTATDSPLSESKRRILAGETIDSHPLRILGPAGSGKTLLMQLLAVKKLLGDGSGSTRQARSVLYLAHSRAMQKRSQEKFELLLGRPLGSGGEIDGARLVVTTLADYCVSQLDLSVGSVLDTDAEGAKQFQLSQVLAALDTVHERDKERVAKSAILKQVFGHAKLLQLFATLVLVEISAAIKGHGLESDKRRYVESERSLSLLHAHLQPPERAFVFDVFLAYHAVVFDHYQTLDPDDIAISLAARLRTPVWQLRRQTEGFDYVFVDEAQLFNENERRLFSLLTKTEMPHVPIALALDQSQATYGQSSAGLSTLGIKGATSETLSAIHRSTEAIVRLAFFVIQRSTALFGPDFPDFTRTAETLVLDSHPLAAPPSIVWQGAKGSFGEFVVERVEALRRENTRQIAVVCYSETYWGPLQSALGAAHFPLQVIVERGAKVAADRPIVALARPAQIGGQEFDAVILVGLEFGLVPPSKIENQALATAVEQQVIRDMYLGITRARYRVEFTVAKGAAPNRFVEMAKDAGLVLGSIEVGVPTKVEGVRRPRKPLKPKQ